MARILPCNEVTVDAMPPSSTSFSTRDSVITGQRGRKIKSYTQDAIAIHDTIMSRLFSMTMS